jgi:zinc protease
LSETNGVIEARLNNGLGLLIKPDHSAPLASVWTWYRVGSRNELLGQTGVSHWVEHMQFKGTPNLGKGQIFGEVARVGGSLNALTSFDWTAYFETVPISALDLPLRIESDRIANSRFDAEEVEAERTVILSERQGAINNPGYLLYEEVLGEAFRFHSYRTMVIGLEHDLRQMTRDDLYQHYRRFYRPSNAFLVAVGDFDPDELIAEIEGAFSKILDDGDTRPFQSPPKEPLQLGERRVLLRRPSGAPYLRMAFHVPASTDPDFVPLLVADAVLSGGKPMGFGGSGGMGRSSRLYRSLVASGLARAASSDLDITLDPFLFQIAATALPGSDLSLIETAVDHEIDALREQPVLASELERAVRQVEAQYVYSSEGVTNQAFWLGQWNLLGNWQRALDLTSEIRAVTAEDVQRVAQTYFRRDQRVVGWLEPTGSGGSAGEVATTGAYFFTPADHSTGAAGRSTNGNTQPFSRVDFDDGVVILGQDRPQSKSVTLRLRIAAGSVYEPPENAGLAHLTARSLLRGAGGRSFAQINERIDRLGSALTADAGRENVELRVRCLSEDLPEMIDLLAHIVTSPDFDPAQIELVRNEQLGAISELDNDTRATADRVMRRGIYPEPNPLGRPVLGSRQSVAPLSSDDVATFWATSFRHRGLTFAIVGGLRGFERVAELLEESFHDWAGQRSILVSPDLSLVNSESLRTTEQIAGKSQTDLALGLATISRLDPDYYALDVTNHILGRQGLMGRLGSEVRDRQGLAYYASSQLEPRRNGSLWVARAGVDPSQSERALASIESELTRIRTSPVSADELQNAHSQLIGVLPLALESHDGVASTLLAIEEFDLGLDYLDRYPGLILAVDRQRCLQVAERHLDPSRLVVGVAEPTMSPEC